MDSFSSVTGFVIVASVVVHLLFLPAGICHVGGAWPCETGRRLGRPALHQRQTTTGIESCDGRSISWLWAGVLGRSPGPESWAGVLDRSGTIFIYGCLGIIRLVNFCVKVNQSLINRGDLVTGEP
jgi:hypothetical protein